MKLTNISNHKKAIPIGGETPTDRTVQILIGFAPLEKRKRRPTVEAKLRHQAALEDITSRLVKRAITGRGWEPQPMSNGYLKGAGGPGKCAKDIVQRLQQLGLIEFRPGYYDRVKGMGRVSTMRATPKLRAIMAGAGAPIIGTAAPITTTVLREGTGKMPEDIRRQDATMRTFNEMAAQRRLGWADGTTGYEVYLDRRFKYDWTKGGRLYGGFWQELPKEERLTLRIDGEPVVELDYRSMQPAILYGIRGRELDFDPYVLPGWNIDRNGGKLVYNRLMNRKGKAARACPINFAKDLHPYFDNRELFRRFVTDMEEHLSVIASFFGTQPWGRLQKEESELMLSVIDRCLERAIPCYPIHDSILVRQSDATIAMKLMKSEFHRRFGVQGHVTI